VIHLGNFDNNSFHNEIKKMKEQNSLIREDINDLILMSKEEALELLENIKTNLKTIHQNIKSMKQED